MEKIEVRSLREAPSANGESRKIEGYAIVFGQESRVLCDWGDYFIETIDREAVNEDLLNSSDVKCLFNHNREKLLARSVNGEGSLSLNIDDYGVRYSFEAPNTPDGNTVYELVKRGDICGSSFAFRADDENSIEYFGEGVDGIPRRTVKKITALYDVSPVIDPAYTQTSVSARAWEKPEEKAEPVEEPEERKEDEVDSTAAVYEAELRRRRLRLSYNV